MGPDRRRNSKSRSKRGHSSRGDARANGSDQGEEGNNIQKARTSLAVLVYLCADNHLTDFAKNVLKELGCDGRSKEPWKQIAIVVQQDRPDGASRYVLLPNETSVTYLPTEHVVNTGHPHSLAEFLNWAFTQVDADHYVIVLSGLGISPRYVRRCLPLDEMESILGGDQPTPKPATGKSKTIRYSNPADLAEQIKFAKKLFSETGDPDRDRTTRYRKLLHERMFSICHDFSNMGSLTIHDLRNALATMLRERSEMSVDDRLAMIVCDVGASGFVEVLFELEGLARTYVGSSRILPDDPIPYAKIFREWDVILPDPGPFDRSNPQAMANGLAAAFVDIAQSEMSDDTPVWKDLIAVDLSLLDDVARSLDTLAVALLHSLGDWHVADAMNSVLSEIEPLEIDESDLHHEQPRKPKLDEKTKELLLKLNNIEFLPAVSLIDLLGKFETAFYKKVKSQSVEEAFGQASRIRWIHELIVRTKIQVSSSNLFIRKSMEGSSSTDTQDRNLTILMPRLRSKKDVDDETGRIFSLSIPSYLRLNFSRRVHWAALVTSLQIIHEKPHVAWRVISSMLADTSGPARDAALGRMISDHSVIGDMRDSFASLGESDALSMSVDPLLLPEHGESLPVALDVSAPQQVRYRDARLYRVRLESLMGSGFVFEQNSRVFQSTLESTMKELTRMLTLNEPVGKIRHRLKMLGSTLGEDILQDMSGVLNDEATSIEQTGEVPHLLLQMHRSLMQYPWELMRDRRGMLCERFALGRQVFLDARSIRAIRPRTNNEIRVLVIGNPNPVYQPPQFGPVGPLSGAESEAKVIIRFFREMGEQLSRALRFKVERLEPGTAITVEKVRTGLRLGKYDIIHFAGHAFFNPQDPDESGWLLSDGILHAREVRNVLAHTPSPPWLVFANACEAGMDRANAPSLYGDVSGLATAFLAQGVAAYIAPLWPVDDSFAVQFAVDFYRNLLQQRFSVGESLRQSRLKLWHSLVATGTAHRLNASVALTWASYALYGEPTARMLPSLWAPATQRRKSSGLQKNDSPSQEPAAFSEFLAPIIAAQSRSAVSIPKSLARDLNSNRGNGETAVRLQLVRRSGFRFWKAIYPGQMQALTISAAGKYLSRIKEEEFQNSQVPLAISGWEDSSPRLIKEWKLDAAIPGSNVLNASRIALEFDGAGLTRPGLFRIRSTRSRMKVEEDWRVPVVLKNQHNKLLLLLHDALGDSRFLVRQIDRLVKHKSALPSAKEPLLTAMRRRYPAMLAWDHPTLTRSPKQNAAELLEKLAAIISRNNGMPDRIDILAHGRGGLVAEELHRLISKSKTPVGIKFGKVICVGTPILGATIAESRNWGRGADITANCLSVDPSGHMGRWSALLAGLSLCDGDSEIPGLVAMTPGNRTSNNSAFWNGVYKIAAAFDSARHGMNYWKSLDSRLKNAGDLPGDNNSDLLYETWSTCGLRIPDKKANDILLYTRYGNEQNCYNIISRSNVHHFNILEQVETVSYIRKILDL